MSLDAQRVAINPVDGSQIVETKQKKFPIIYLHPPTKDCQYGNPMGFFMNVMPNHIENIEGSNLNDAFKNAPPMFCYKVNFHGCSAELNKSKKRKKVFG